MAQGPQETNLGTELKVLLIRYSVILQTNAQMLNLLLTWTDHNIVCITKYTKMPKRPPGVTIIFFFNLEDYQRDLATAP